jgi:Mg2+/Co2+ transporter CorB
LNAIPLGFLLGSTVGLFAALAFVVSAEASLLNVPRSRVRQFAAAGNRSAQLADELLREPERIRLAARTIEALLLIGLAGSAALLLVRWHPAMLVPGLLITAVLALLCAHVLPHFARSERIGVVSVSARFFQAARVLTAPFLLLLLYRPQRKRDGDLTVSHGESDACIDHRLLRDRVADLDNIAVDDIMVPRNEIAAIDISDDWDDVLTMLRSTPHTRLPLCENGIDNIIGIVHMKRVAHSLARGELSRERLLEIARARDAYFTPEGTTLSDQLVNFKRDRRRVAFVVDEYGDIQGLVTLEDILEEVVGEFTASPALLRHGLHRERGETYVVSGSASVRDLNRTMGWTLPVDGPRTLNGLIVEHLETIPPPGATFRLEDLSMEILQTAGNAVKSVRVRRLEGADLERELSKGVA